MLRELVSLILAVAGLIIVIHSIGYLPIRITMFIIGSSIGITLFLSSAYLIWRRVRNGVGDGNR